MSKFKKGDMAKNISDQDRSLTMGKEYPVLDVDLSGNIEFLDDDGDYRTRRADDYVLGADEPALPVRTRIITEIVPGKYAGFHVGANDAGRVHVVQGTDEMYTAAELRAAARVFVSLAEALEWEEYK